MVSFWEKQSWFHSADLLIIGGGIVGLSAALHAKIAYPAKRIVVLEKGVRPAGASVKNAGFACFGSPSELLADLEQHDPDFVFSIVEKRWKGLLQLRALLSDNSIDYLPVGGSEVFRSQESLTAALTQLDYLNDMLRDITGLTNTYQYQPKAIEKYGFEGVFGLLFNVAEGQLNPGKLMKQLLLKVQQCGVEVYFGSEMTSLDLITNESWSVGVNHYTSIKAQKVLLCTNGYTSSLIPDLSNQIYPARNQVLLTAEIPDLSWEGCFHLEEGYFYFRNVGKRVLIGGGRHLDLVGETTDQSGTSPHIQQALEDLLSDVILPGKTFTIDHRWSGILGVGTEKMPLIQWIQPGLATGVRLGGMGVAIGTLVGQEAASFVMQDEK